jgi:hypothetical protein
VSRSFKQTPKLAAIGLAAALLVIGTACGGEAGSADNPSTANEIAVESTVTDSTIPSTPLASTTTIDVTTTLPSATTIPVAPTTTTIPIAVTTTAAVPQPTVTEAEVADLEQQLDEIDQLLAEIELDFSQD